MLQVTPVAWLSLLGLGCPPLRLTMQAGYGSRQAEIQANFQACQPASSKSDRQPRHWLLGAVCLSVAMATSDDMVTYTTYSGDMEVEVCSQSLASATPNTIMYHFSGHGQYDRNQSELTNKQIQAHRYQLPE